MRIRRALFLGLMLGVFVRAPAADSQSASGNFCAQDMGATTCAANDITFAPELVQVIDSCTSESDTAVLQLNLTLQADVERYDVGYFVATDGGDALSGDQCVVSNLDLPLWPSYEAAGDVCGDIGPVDSPYTGALGQFTVACTDRDDDGLLDVSTCGSWRNQESTGTGSSPHCAAPTDVGPASGSQCSCDLVSFSSVPVPTATPEPTLTPDDTAPTCGPGVKISGRKLEIPVSDDGSGLQSIEILRKTNLKVVMPTFSPGTTEQQVVTGTKRDRTRRAVLELMVDDVAGLPSTCAMTLK